MTVNHDTCSLILLLCCGAGIIALRHGVKENKSYADALEESEMVIFDCVENLLNQSGIRPEEVMPLPGYEEGLPHVPADPVQCCKISKGGHQPVAVLPLNEVNEAASNHTAPIDCLGSCYTVSCVDQLILVYDIHTQPC